MKKDTNKKEQKNANIDADAKALKALAKTVGGLVYKDQYGEYVVDQAKATRKESAPALLTCVKILRELAKADAFACVNDGRLFHNASFSVQSRHAVFNARLLAAGQKGVL